MGHWMRIATPLLLIAFADHAAEFYAGSGNDCQRALELTRVNVANRPTRRAVKQADVIAVNAAERATSTKRATQEYPHDDFRGSKQPRSAVRPRLKQLST